MALSMRLRFLVGIICSIVLVLVLFDITIYTATRLSFMHEFDRSLLSTARMLCAGIEDEGENHGEDTSENKYNREVNSSGQNQIKLELDLNATPEFNIRFGGSYYQVSDIKKGISIIKSPSLAGTDLRIFTAHLKTKKTGDDSGKNTDTASLETSYPEEPSDKVLYSQCLLPDGKAGRAVRYIFVLKSKNTESQTVLSIIVARDPGNIYHHLSFLKNLLILSTAAVTIVAFIATLIVIRAGLKPLEKLAEEISYVDSANLKKQRVSEKYAKELLPVVTCLNSLLERLTISFEREKRLNSDIAHELRTPIAGIKSTIEVCLSQVRQTNEYESALTTCLDISNNMYRMVESLLSIARLENSFSKVKHEAIYLKELFDTCWTESADKANDRKITLENKVQDECIVLSNKIHLKVIVNNIIDNAIEYTNMGSQIWAESTETANHITLSLSNTMDDSILEKEHLKEIFDPFWRQEKSRTETGKHCGIGLSLVRKIADILDAKVEAAISNGVFTIYIMLPIGNQN